MKSKWILITGLLFIGCYKNVTNYYADTQDNGLAIFSNTGNNIFSCYVNGQPWRTANRTTGGFLSQPRSEVHLSKQADSSSQDFLVFQWNGHLQQSPNDYDIITLYLKIPKNFTRNDISSFQGQRFVIDSSRGYFSANINGFNNNNERGTGNIYFNSASFDSSGLAGYTGKLSGILEADFPGFKITKGRFDHQLSFLQVQF